MADIVVVAKTNAASQADIQAVSETARRLAPKAVVARGTSIVSLDDRLAVAGKRVIVVDDGPTITHGGMSYGAGYVAAQEAQVAEIVDPRLSAVGDIAEAFRRYPHIGKVLPAMGYAAGELRELQATINGSDADAVIAGTPSDLSHLIRLDKPVVRARYEFGEVGEPRLSGLIDNFLHRRRVRSGLPAG
jgi:predicted GTPase